MNASSEPFRAADDRATWLDPIDWKLANKYTTGATELAANTEAVAQMRVEIFTNRKDPTKVRVWAQLWQRLRGAAEFEPTDPVIAFEVDLGSVVDQLVRKGSR